jgi:IS605 OrfB family transposase
VRLGYDKKTLRNKKKWSYKMKKAKKVTRIAYADDLNQAKYDALNKIAKHCGSIRTEVWRNYGSVGGLGAKFRPVRDGWIADKHVLILPQRIWRATLSDTLDDVKAYREAAKEKVVRHIFRNIDDKDKRKDLFKKLKNDSVWVNDSYLRRLMRKYWKHGNNHTFNQIVLEPGSYKLFSHNGKNYIEVISLKRGKRIAIPIGTNYSITGQIRLILRDGQVEIHYTIDNTDDRACGNKEIGIDKGYTEVFVDSEGEFYGKGLGEVLSKESDYLNKKYQRRNKIKAVLDKVEQKNPKKARRIRKHNLGRKKLNRRKQRQTAAVKTIVFTAVNRVVDKAKTIVCEDLTKTFKSRSYGKNTDFSYRRNRLSGWVKGLMARAIEIVASRRGSRVVQVNAAYSSQICSQCGCFGKRTGDKFHCASGCGAVMQADLNAAVNVKARSDDKELHRWLPFLKVKQILLERCRQSDETAHPVV